jgi:hypothetical protein
VIENSGEEVGEVSLEGIEAAKNGFDGFDRSREGSVGEEGVELVDVGVADVPGGDKVGLRSRKRSGMRVKKVVIDDGVGPTP